MNLLKRLLGNFGAEMDIWFFYGFLLTFPFSIRKVITFFPIRGQFNEYSGIYLYLSDIFLGLTLFSWIIILCNKYILLSIDSLRSFWRDKLWKRGYPQVNPNLTLAYLGLILIVWSFSSLLWSESKSLSFFRSIKLFEFYLLAIFIAYRIVSPKNTCSTPTQMSHPSTNVPPQYKCSTPVQMFHPSTNVPRGTFYGAGLPTEALAKAGVEHFTGQAWNIWRETFILIIAGGLINALIGLFQFLTQKSVGLFWLKESLISPMIPGVAKIEIWGHRIVRAYGFFPHPNILGGFLLISIILTLLYQIMFRLDTNVPPQYKCSTWNILRGRRGTFYGAGLPTKALAKGGVEHSRVSGIFWSYIMSNGWLAPLICLIQAIALLLTFSKSAILGLFIGLAYIYVSQPRRKDPDNTENETSTPDKMLHTDAVGVPPQDKYSAFSSSNVPRGTFDSGWNILGGGCEKLKGLWNINPFVKQLVKIALFTFLLISLIISFFPNLSPIQNQSLLERKMLMDVSQTSVSCMFHACPPEVLAKEGGTIANNSFLGVGQGQLTWSMRNNTNLLDWQFQPVHNVFLLIWSELGIVGLILFSWLLWKMFHSNTNIPSQHECSTPVQMFHPDTNVPRGTFYGAGVEHFTGQAWNILRGRFTHRSFSEGGRGTFEERWNIHFLSQVIFKGILLGFIFILLFDHYPWDIQQGQIMLWLVLGFVYGLNLTGKNKSDTISL